MRPYPEDVNKTAVAESIYDIETALKHLHRAQSSTETSEEFADQVKSVRETLKSELENLSEKQKQNQLVNGAQEVIYAVARNESDMDFVEASDHVSHIIDDGDFSEKREIIEVYEDNLDRDIQSEVSSEEMFDILTEVIREGNY